MIVVVVEIGGVEGRRPSLVGVLWIWGERIGGLVVDGARWAFGMGRPLDGSLLRWARQHLARRHVVVVAAEVDWQGEAAVVENDIHSEDLAGGMVVSRLPEVFFVVVL